MDKKNFDVSLYLVTDPHNKTPLQFLDTLEKALMGGVTIVQLREKKLDEESFIQKAMAVAELCHSKDIPLIINDSVTVAKKARAQGVHLGQSDSKISHAREILGQNAIIGLSLEHVSHIHHPSVFFADYVAASPVFPTATKKDISPPLLLDGLREIKKHAKVPVVAIGGINEMNLGSVLEAGADGIAMVSALFFAPEPCKTASYFLNLIKKFRENACFQEKLT